MTKSEDRVGMDGLVRRGRSLEVEECILNKKIIKVISGNSYTSQLFVKEVRTQHKT